MEPAAKRDNLPHRPQWKAGTHMVQTPLRGGGSCDIDPSLFRPKGSDASGFCPFGFENSPSTELNSRDQVASEGTGVSELAVRYSIALFELADENKALDQVASDLSALKQMLAESADLRRLVRSPVISRADQGRAMDAVLDGVGVSDLTKRFIGLVAKNRRLFALNGMIDGYLAELARRRGEVTAQVTSATPLSAAQLQSVTDQLRAAIGSKVLVNATVDPALIGGMIVKYGSRMVDTSVRTKLDKLQLAMKASGGAV
jgi:F-type H+-transporting ATPase subunit delta